jgi:hypothetical protein
MERGEVASFMRPSWDAFFYSSSSQSLKRWAIFGSRSTAERTNASAPTYPLNRSDAQNSYFYERKCLT